MPRVLLIEDNEDLAFGLSKSLEANGHEVVVARDGVSGLRRLVEHPPAVVILDLMLPGAMDGHDLLREARRRRLDMPVLVLTARGEGA